MAQKNTVPSVCTEKDITETSAFLNIKKRQEQIWKPSENHASDFAHPETSPDGLYLVGVAAVADDLKGLPKEVLTTIRLSDGEIQKFGSRQGSDSYPKWSPDGKSIAFISAVDEGSQLHLLDLKSKGIKVIKNIPGSIENLTWAPNGAKILLNVAGIGADKGMTDGGNLKPSAKAPKEESWMPAIKVPASSDQYRTVWMYDVATEHVHHVSPAGLNFWEAVWGSNGTIIGVCSELPGEEYWYFATLRRIDVERQTVEVLYTPPEPNSMEDIRSSPSGSRTAFVQGIASDRKGLWGDLYLYDAATSQVTEIDTLGADIGGLAWCSESDLVAAGARGQEEVILHYDALTRKTQELWNSEKESIGPFFKPEISAYKSEAAIECTFVLSGFFQAPTLVHLADHGLKTIHKFGSEEYEEKMQQLCSHETVEWKAPDGLVIQGQFLTPSAHPAPYPTILAVHGGPIAQWRARYVGDCIKEDVPDWVFLEAGFAIFKPNVRGSTGRGQVFVRHVYQDMGGVDTYDYLSGIDALVESGRADPKRLGVYGVSYGGYMACWLVTQTDRFAAAVPVAMISDWVSEHYTSILGKWIETFLGDGPHDVNGKYYTRSPLHYMDKATTPTLLICGEKDGGCPPGQALEFHNAWLEKGGISVVVKYPEEGHGVRNRPAYYDFSARTIEWFKHYVLG